MLAPDMQMCYMHISHRQLPAGTTINESEHLQDSEHIPLACSG